MTDLKKSNTFLPENDLFSWYPMQSSRPEKSQPLRIMLEALIKLKI